MKSRSFWIGAVSLLAAGCAAGLPEESEVASTENAASCVGPFDPRLAESVKNQPGPYRVRIDFTLPPPMEDRLWWGLAECTGTSCSGLVEREKLERLCRDSNVRDMEAWP